MQNNFFSCFNAFSFLARRSNARLDAPKTRRLKLETLEDRALLSSVPYGPFYESDVVLKSAENETAVVASEPIDLNFEVKTSTYNDGQVLSLTFNASKPISVWQIDWGDGSAPSVYEKLSDSLIAAHSYELQATEQEYAVVAKFAELGGEISDEEYCVAFHTTPAKAVSVGTTTTEGTTTTFVTNEFYDAEKSSSSNSNLCWAAGASNALYYAGWATSEPLTDSSGKSVSFESEDDVFSYFTENFDNGGTSVLYAFEWFITGEYPVDGVSGWAQSEEDSGGFYTDVNFQDVSHYYTYRSSGSHATIIQNATEQLEQGWAVCASLGFYTSTPKSSLKGAHTLSVWGYVCDESYSSDDPEYYTGLIISDPDDSKYRGRSAPDKLVALQLEWSDTYDHYRVTNYSSSYSVWLEEFITLAPRASVSATPNRTTEALADVLTLDARRREEENFFELLEEANESVEP